MAQWHISEYLKPVTSLQQTNKQTNNTKHDLWVTHVWYPVTNKMSRRQRNNRHHYLLAAAHRESLKDSTALHSIQNDGNAFLFYNSVQCRVFLSSLTHHHLLKQTNITKYLSKYENVCIPTVYQTPLISVHTLQGSEFYSQWHLEHNNAMQCALAWDVPGVWP